MDKQDRFGLMIIRTTKAPKMKSIPYMPKLIGLFFLQTSPRIFELLNVELKLYYMSRPKISQFGDAAPLLRDKLRHIGTTERRVVYGGIELDLMLQEGMSSPSSWKFGILDTIFSCPR